MFLFELTSIVLFLSIFFIRRKVLAKHANFKKVLEQTRNDYGIHAGKFKVVNNLNFTTEKIEELVKLKPLVPAVFLLAISLFTGYDKVGSIGLGYFCVVGLLLNWVLSISINAVRRGEWNVTFTTPGRVYVIGMADIFIHVGSESTLYFFIDSSLVHLLRKLNRQITKPEKLHYYPDLQAWCGKSELKITPTQAHVLKRSIDSERYNRAP